MTSKTEVDRHLDSGHLREEVGPRQFQVERLERLEHAANEVDAIEDRVLAGEHEILEHHSERAGRTAVVLASVLA
jgi:hypothetical protein